MTTLSAPPRRRRPPEGAARPRRDVLGAFAGQGTQALLGLGAQVLAARVLSPSDWGRYAVLYGVIVLLAACASGFVGDSLTVLDRRDPRVRRGLRGWTLVWCVASPLVVGLVCLVTGTLTAVESALIAVAAAAFATEELTRRAIMARLRFWRLVVVDSTGLIVLVVSLAVASTVGVTGLALPLLSLAAGQLAAAAVARGITPRDEPPWSAPSRGGMALVASYGALRAAQAMVRPGLLTATRLLVVVAVGAAATGDLEAARVFVAPVLLLVSGLSTYLFATFATAHASSTAALVRRADRAVLRLLVGAAVLGICCVALTPALGGLVAGRPLDVVSVAGWAAYAVSVAAVTPYGSLAAVRGGQARVLGVRVLDSLVSLGGALLLLSLGGPVSLVPLVLAGGSVLGAVLTRRVVLRLGESHARRPASSDPPSRLDPPTSLAPTDLPHPIRENRA